MKTILDTRYWILDKILKKSAGFVLILLLASSIQHPASSIAAFSKKSAGTSGAAFLKIGAGARPSAMGEAFTAVADDVNTIFWNTAGLATLKKKNEFVAMRAEMFQGLQYNMFAFAHPTKSWGTIAVGLNNLNISDIEQRTGDTDKPDATFSSNDSAYTLAYACKISLSSPFIKGGNEGDYGDEGGLFVGASLKAIRQTLSGDQANSFGSDLGVLYQGNESPFSAGFAVQNLGSKVQFKSESDPLPLTVKLGLSYRIGEEWRISGIKGAEGEKTGLLGALDAHIPRDDDASARVGVEYVSGWTENLRSAVRAGYQSGKAREIDATGTGISAGVGMTYKFFTFDFAWTPYGDLGNTFRYSIKLRF